MRSEKGKVNSGKKGIMEKPHKKLEVWKKALDIVVWIYRTTGKYPREEMYGLTAQMRRAAISIVSNISEGAARNNKKEFARFLYFAKGSLSELDSQVVISNVLGFMMPEDFAYIEGELEQEDKMLSGLIRSIEKPASQKKRGEK